MKVAAIQHDIVWEDARSTCAALEPMVAGAAACGARLVVLTEMFATGFSMNPDKIVEPRGGPTDRWLVSQAQKHDIWICGSIPTAGDTNAKPVNRLVLAAPNGSTRHYDKIHPFTYSKEDEFYAAGSGHVTVEIEGILVSLFVCYDLRFADEFWGLAHSTDCYVVVANWPEARRLHWQTLLQARAIENQAYVIGVNRVGEGGNLVYAGDSRIIDPLGEILAAGARTEAILIAEIDAAKVAQTRAKFPFLQDRR